MLEGVGDGLHGFDLPYLDLLDDESFFRDDYDGLDDPFILED